MPSQEGIPINDLGLQYARLRPRINAAIERVFRHGKFILGPEVEELEASLARFSGAHEVVTCASGTDALLIALLAEGIGPGDAVFIPSFTFAATVEAVVLLRATPVFVDVNRETFLIDLTSLNDTLDELQITSLRPRAVIPVDLYGQPADYTAACQIAETHGLLVISDAAQSFGASRSGKRVGALAPVTATSFYPTKPLGCYGDGGALFTGDPARAEIYRSLRVHGRGKDQIYNSRVGFNSRLDTLQAAILIEKLALLDAEIEMRQRVASRYTEALRDVACTPAIEEGCICAWAQYTIRVEQRDRLAEGLRKRGIETAVYYPVPLHHMEPYRDYPVAPGGLPVSETLARTVVSLPMHPYLGHDTQDRIIAATREILAG
jgi:dTDP-4-amino-4,6-dideoxygalactose transaminase